MTDTPHELDEADLAPPTVIVEPIAVDDLNAAQRSPFAWRVQVACVLEQPFDELHFFSPLGGRTHYNYCTLRGEIAFDLLKVGNLVVQLLGPQSSDSFEILKKFGHLRFVDDKPMGGIVIAQDEVAIKAV